MSPRTDKHVVLDLALNHEVGALTKLALQLHAADDLHTLRWYLLRSTRVRLGYLNSLAHVNYHNMISQST